MIFHFGNKTTRKYLGRVADYCLMCHARRPFQVFKVRLSFHILEIPLDETKFLGFERVCEACGQRYPADAKAYAAISREKTCAIESLIHLTNPGLTAGLPSELALNELLQSRSLSRDDRLSLIAGPFHAIHPMIKERAQNTHVDVWSGICIVATFVVPLLIIAFLGIGDPSREPAMITAGALLLASLALLATDVRRYIRKAARPRLIRALASFDPTLEELESLATKDTVVAEVARRINLERLHRDLRAEPVEFN